MSIHIDEYRTRAEEIVEYCCKTVKPAGEWENDWEKEYRAHEEETFQRSAKLFNDSVHGSIEVNSLERAIIDSPEFYRLKDIKQLGGKFHVYHGATHTRFQHSIGVCHLAGELVQHLKKQEEDRKDAKGPTIPREEEEDKKDAEGPTISKKEELCLRIAGLCHDLGHGPFSHLFETVTRRVMDREDVHHELLSRLMFKKILLDNPKVLVIFVVHCNMTVHEVKMIEQMISPNAPGLMSPEQLKNEAFLYEIVANKESGMDVDKWDYFARDFLHLGVTYEFDWRRCMKQSSIVKVEGKYHIGFRDKEMSNIYGMFRTRSILYVKALRHNTVQAVEMMLMDILVLAKDVQYETRCGGKTSLRKAVEDAYTFLTKEEPSDLSGYVALTDSILHLIMHSPIKEEDMGDSMKEARTLIDRLRKRELYKMIDEKTIEEGLLVHEQSKEIKELVKRYNKSLKDFGEIKLVCYKLASEETLNPVEAMFFFLKSKSKAIPDGLGEKDRDRAIHAVSSLCKPEKLIEYRIRLYTKVLKTEEESHKENLTSAFKKCYKEIITEYLQSVVKAQQQPKEVPNE